MADLTTYEGLKAAVADYLGRDDLEEQIPTFIRMAETRFNRDLRVRIMERRKTIAVTAGSESVDLPNTRTATEWDVFLEMRDISWTDGSDVQNLTYMPVDSYRVIGSFTGRPKRYTIVGESLYLEPKPDCDGQIMLTYYSEIQPLSDTITSNSLLATAPDLYLYGSLMESASFTRGSVPVELWQQYYTESLNKLKANDRRATFTCNIAMTPVRRI